jgi:hypothetical protein
MKSTFYAGVAAAALLVGFAAPSHASLILKVSDGITTDTITDLANSGAATFSGALGAFSFNVVTGTSAPLIGTLALPTLDLNSIDITPRNSSGGTLTFKLTDTDYIGGSGITHFFNAVGGTLSGLGSSYSVNTFMDCSNSAFGTGTALTSQSFTGSAFSGGKDAYVSSCSGNYSLTQLATLTLASGSIYSGDSSLAVPEPPAIALFGAGLLGLCFALRRKERPGSMAAAA